METNCMDRAETGDLFTVRAKIRQLLVLRQDWNFEYAFLYAELLVREARLLSAGRFRPPMTV
jgi:hypothetical protein